jgi:hypothetical protein
VIRRLALLLCLTLSQPLAASEPSGVYMQVPLSRAALDAWLASALPQAEDFHDWASMNPQWREDWRRYFTTLPAASVGDFLAGWEAAPQDSAGMAWCHDATVGELRLGAVFYDENFVSFATLLAALREVAKHQSRSEAGYVYIYPLPLGRRPGRAAAYPPRNLRTARPRHRPTRAQGRRRRLPRRPHGRLAAGGRATRLPAVARQGSGRRAAGTTDAVTHRAVTAQTLPCQSPARKDTMRQPAASFSKRAR